MQSVIDGWEKRWAAKAPKLWVASWPDEHARDLELREVARHYAQVTGRASGTAPLTGASGDGAALPVLELGCGAGTILEGGHCQFSEYRGIDASKTALAATPNRGDWAWLQADLTQKRPLEAVREMLNARTHFLISRRFLINLTQKERKPLIGLLTLAPHGILIETEAASMKRMNLARGENGLQALPPQPHNFWLTSNEAATIISHTKGERRMFMSEYYYASRIVDQKRYDTARNKKAWERQLEVNKHTSGLAGDPSYGLTAFCW